MAVSNNNKKKFSVLKFGDNTILAIGTWFLKLMSYFLILLLDVGKKTINLVCTIQWLKKKDTISVKGSSIHLPKVLNKQVGHVKNTKSYVKEFMLKSFLHQIGTLCKCLSLRNFVFISLFSLTSVIIVFNFAKHRQDIAVTSSLMAPVAQENINIDEIDKIINAMNSLPMTLVSAKTDRPSIYRAESHLEYVAITLKKSIFRSGKKAGLSANMMKKFMDIFNTEVNFSKDVRDNDKITMLYKRHIASGKAKRKLVYDNEILAAEFVNNKKVYRAIRFTDARGQTSYYTPQGISIKPSMMRAPLNYSHISSRFSHHRWNPILGLYRPHLGVDFVAPIGTPIKAAGDGHVIFIGVKGGYGNAIIIRHNDKYSTLYAHLSHFAKKIKRGSIVERNQLIGYLGNSGLSTGPHLHYEVRVYNIQHDPLSIRLPHFAILKHKDRVKFFALTKALLAQMRTSYPQYAVNVNEKKSQVPA